jgi:hypothetical protein
MLVSMVVNVYQMQWADLHVIVQIHIPDNDVKIVSRKKEIKFVDKQFSY